MVKVVQLSWTLTANHSTRDANKKQERKINAGTGWLPASTDQFPQISRSRCEGGLGCEPFSKDGKLRQNKSGRRKSGKRKRKPVPDTQFPFGQGCDCASRGGTKVIAVSPRAQPQKAKRKARFLTELQNGQNGDSVHSVILSNNGPRANSRRNG